MPAPQRRLSFDVGHHVGDTVMTNRPDTQNQRFAIVAKALLKNPAVTLGSKGEKGFGSSALQLNDKIFAMLSSNGQFVVKLPKERVDSLIASGNGERFDPGHGRLMKQWLAIEPTSDANWLALAREAMEFVGSKN